MIVFKTFQQGFVYEFCLIQKTYSCQLVICWDCTLSNFFRVTEFLRNVIQIYHFVFQLRFYGFQGVNVSFWVVEHDRDVLQFLFFLIEILRKPIDFVLVVGLLNLQVRSFFI